MSDAAPSGSGRGSGSRKGKFTPTIPGRRKKETDPLAIAALATGAPSDAFKQLQDVSEKEASWQRAARGRGRGTAPGHANARATVTFGGPGGKMLLPSGRTSAGTKGGDGKPGGGAKSEGGAKSATGGAQADDAEPDQSKAALPVGRPSQPPDRLKAIQDLDYDVYYPAVLPMRPPPVLEEQYPQFVQEGPDDTSVAAALQLLQQPDSEELMLVQLPPLLPVVSGKQTAEELKQEASTSGRPGAAQAGSAAHSGAPGAAASSLRDLPSGKIGKLLVFKSGRVQLQMGEVLMDVSPGLLCQHRQEVVAISSNSADFVALGPATHGMVVSPDLWQLMDDRPVPNWPRKLWQPDLAAPGVSAPQPHHATEGAIPASATSDIATPAGSAAAGVSGRGTQGGPGVTVKAEPAAGTVPPAASGVPAERVVGSRSKAAKGGLGSILQGAAAVAAAAAAAAAVEDMDADEDANDPAELLGPDMDEAMYGEDDGMAGMDDDDDS